MNPNIAWEEAQAKLADLRREAEHRHMEGEAHRACKVCGLTSGSSAEHCQHCGHKLHLSDLRWRKRSGP